MELNTNKRLKVLYVEDEEKQREEIQESLNSINNIRSVKKPFMMKELIKNAKELVA